MILISHSFAADDILATSLEKGLLHAGLAPFNLREFGKILEFNCAGGSDRTDLDNAWRLAGYQRSTQERSDPGLLLKLIDVLRQVDTLLVLNELAEKGERLAASCYWDLCRERLDEDVLATIDHWLG
jgi:hypothetical protein